MEKMAHFETRFKVGTVFKIHFFSTKHCRKVLGESQRYLELE